MTAATSLTTGSDLIDRVFGPVLERQTYRNALYLLLSFPLGLAYFITMVVGLSVGIGTAIIVVGLGVLAGTLWLARMFGRIERQLTTALLGATFDTTRISPLKWRAALTDQRTWTTLLFLFLRFPIGVASLVAVVLFAVSIPIMAAPMLYSFVPISVDGSLISTSEDALLVSLIGCVLFLILVHVVNGLGALSRRLATALL